jgi:signal transduction histidine kinase
VTLSIRKQLTIRYAVLIAMIVAVLGLGVLLAAFLGMKKAADQELTAGLSGVEAFLQHKLDIHQMDNLNDEFREHSALLPHSKMFRVSNHDGSVIYQPDIMMQMPSMLPEKNSLRKQSIDVQGRLYRTASRYAFIGSYTFLIQVAVDESEYRELLEGLGWILALSVPLAGLLASLAGYWMSGKVLAPIHRITETTNMIDARSLSLRLLILGTNDELDRLSATINRMLDRIAASYERIAQFTSDASHELRAPVALIRSNAELMLMSQDNPPRVQGGLSDILAESVYMTRLIEDLLTLARGGSNHATISMELLELNEPIRSVVDRVQAMAAAHGCTLTCSLLDQVVALYGNQSMLERVLMVLIDNAVRYTPAGGQMTVETWAEHDRCGYVVRDNGIGIAKANHERIFERFFRVDTARTPRDSGYGLGLAIARSLIELHQGVIHVESAIGEGARFRVSLLRADVPESVHAAVNG